MYENRLEPVCGSNLNAISARLICRELGYANVDTFGHRPYRQVEKGRGHQLQTNRFVAHVCRHKARQLADCSLVIVPNCDQQAVLQCSPEMYAVTPIVPLRLFNGFKREGRLEIYHNKQWGSICEDGFNDLAAKVACRHLGFTTGRSVWYGSAYWGPGNSSMPIHIRQVSCVGNEDYLSECSIEWSSGNCNHYQDVGVICDVPSKTRHHVPSRVKSSDLIRSRKSLLPKPQCGKREDPDFINGRRRMKRMIGGEISKRNSKSLLESNCTLFTVNIGWPWQVAVIENGKTICGGALISATQILTSAHCVYSKKISIKVGDYHSTIKEENEFDIVPKEVRVHPRFNPVSYANDIAMIIIPVSNFFCTTLPVYE